MANANPNRSGQADATGATDALWLKVFSGEVLASFGRTSAFRGRHQERVIAHGKSATFPVTGQASGFYHTPGEELLGGTIRHGERVIVVDDLLVAPIFVPNIDEAKNHFEVRSIYSNEIGEALGKSFDQNVGRTFINSARSAAVITGGQGGAYSNNASYATDGTVIWNGIFNAGVTLDGKDIPQSDRYAWLDPVRYALVVMSEKPIDRDLNPDNGSIAMGNVGRINAIPLVKTNNMPSADDRANLNIPENRRFDYSPTKVIVGHRSGAGTVRLQDLTMEQQYDIRRQGHLIVGKYLVGHGALRPESVVELRTADPSA